MNARVSAWRAARRFCNCWFLRTRFTVLTVMSSKPSRLRSKSSLSFCCRCCSSISSLLHFSFLSVGDLQSRLSSLRYSSSSRDLACCCKSSTVGPINEDCSQTLPRVRRTCNTKDHDYTQYFNMLAERMPVILGAFAKWRQATISFVMSVCPSAWNYSAPTGWILVKFDIWLFFGSLSRKFKFN